VEINGCRATIVPAARALARHLGEAVHVAVLDWSSGHSALTGVSAPPPRCDRVIDRGVDRSVHAEQAMRVAA
jgi:hypothetical protein